MINHVTFLRETAAVLRDLAQRAPRIADALRLLADEVDSKAAELERNKNEPPDPRGHDPGLFG